MMLLLLLAALAALAIAALAYIALRSQLAPGPKLTGRTLVVHTRQPDGQTFRGVLVAQHADRFTLAESVVLHASGEQAVGGLVHVPAVNVSSIQEIEAPASR